VPLRRRRIEQLVMRPQLPIQSVQRIVDRLPRQRVFRVRDAGGEVVGGMEGFLEAPDLGAEEAGFEVDDCGF